MSSHIPTQHTVPYFFKRPFVPSLLIAASLGSFAFGEIKLSWEDNSANESGFIIERASGAAAFEEIARVGTNITSYTDKSTVGPEGFRYRVQAYNDNGISRFTNTAEALAAASGLEAVVQNSSSGGAGKKSATAPDKEKPAPISKTSVYTSAKASSVEPNPKPTNPPTIGKPVLTEPELGFPILSGKAEGFASLSDDVAFLGYPTSDNSSISARLGGFSTKDTKAKVGLMHRSSRAHDASFAAVFFLPNGRVKATWRIKNGGKLRYSSIREFGKDATIRLTRRGSESRIEVSADGVKWTTLERIPVTLSSKNYLNGLMFASGSKTVFHSAALEVISSSIPEIAAAPSILAPQIASATPIGKPAYAKKAPAYDSGTQTYTLKDTGPGFERYNDQLTFFSWEAANKSRLAIHVKKFNADYRYARVGIMIRSNDNPNSAMLALISDGKGRIQILGRGADGRKSYEVTLKSQTHLPHLALERVGNDLNLQHSSDGKNWTTLRTVSSPVKADHYKIGIVLGSHKKTSTAEVQLLELVQ